MTLYNEMTLPCHLDLLMQQLDLVIWIKCMWSFFSSFNFRHGILLVSLTPLVILQRSSETLTVWGWRVLFACFLKYSSNIKPLQCSTKKSAHCFCLHMCIYSFNDTRSSSSVNHSFFHDLLKIQGQERKSAETQDELKKLFISSQFCFSSLFYFFFFLIFFPFQWRQTSSKIQSPRTREAIANCCKSQIVPAIQKGMKGCSNNSNDYSQW